MLSMMIVDLDDIKRNNEQVTPSSKYQCPSQERPRKREEKQRVSNNIYNGSTVIQSTRGRSICTPTSTRWIRSVQRPPIVRITFSGSRIVFPCGNLAQRGDRTGRKVRVMRQRGSILYRRRWEVSLVRWRGSKVVVVIPRRMWRVSITRPRRRGLSLSSWGIWLLLLLRPTTSMVERSTRTRRGRPLMWRRTIPKCIRMWRVWVEILRRMRVVIIIRWVLLLLLLWRRHRRLRVTLHGGPTWSGSSSWTTSSPVHVVMIGVPRRWRA